MTKNLDNLGISWRQRLIATAGYGAWVWYMAQHVIFICCELIPTWYQPLKAALSQEQKAKKSLKQNHQTPTNIDREVVFSIWQKSSYLLERLHSGIV